MTDMLTHAQCPSHMAWHVPSTQAPCRPPHETRLLAGPVRRGAMAENHRNGTRRRLQKERRKEPRRHILVLRMRFSLGHVPHATRYTAPYMVRMCGSYAHRATMLQSGGSVCCRRRYAIAYNSFFGHSLSRGKKSSSSLLKVAHTTAQAVRAAAKESGHKGQSFIGVL